MLKMYLKAMDLKHRLLKDVSGATAIEYGLIAAGIAVAIITVVFTLGEDISGLFSGIAGKIQGATPS